MFDNLRIKYINWKQGKFNKKSHKEWSKKSPLTREQIEYLDKKFMEMFYG